LNEKEEKGFKKVKNTNTEGLKSEAKKNQEIK
jgi:hypothetical protein